jgi:hypothetical protein
LKIINLGREGILMTRFAFALISLMASTAFASEYPQMTLQGDSLICFDSDDWESMMEASIDQDAAAMQRLVDSGACRIVEQPMKVSYLDPAAGGGALIQLRSGKTAYTANSYLSN